MLSVTLEITPPAVPRRDILLRRARCLGTRPDRIHVITRPERWSSLLASIALSEAGCEPVWHLANRGRSVAGIDAEIARARDGGLRRVLCVRGEHKARDGDETPTIRETVGRVARDLPGAEIAVTLNQHLPATRTLPNLWPKLAAGATRVQTQVAFDLEALDAVAEHIAARAPSVAIVPMLLPVTSVAAALRASRRLSVPFPRDALERLERGGATAGWERFEALVGAIRGSRLYAGVAVMTPIDPTPAFAARLRAALDARAAPAGAARAPA